MKTQSEVFYAKGYTLLMLKALRTAYPKHAFKILKNRLDSLPVIHLGVKAKRKLFFDLSILYVFDEAIEEIPKCYATALKEAHIPTAFIKNLILAAKSIQEEPYRVLDLLIEANYGEELKKPLQTRLLLEQIEQDFEKETKG